MVVQKKILVVDDDKDYGRMVKVLIESLAGYDVQVENTSTLAVEAAKTFRPDLIVLDLMMPERSGFEILDDIFAAEHDALPVPVLVLTALDTEEAELDAVSRYSSGFVVKTSSLKETLIPRIQEVFGQFETVQ